MNITRDLTKLTNQEHEIICSGLHTLTHNEWFEYNKKQRQLLEKGLYKEHYSFKSRLQIDRMKEIFRYNDLWFN